VYRERLIIFLFSPEQLANIQTSIDFVRRCWGVLTPGTESLRAALAASVVTVLFTSAALEKALLRNGAALPALNALENILSGRMDFRG